MNQWEYLEVLLDLSKKSWRDSEGRRGKLRKGSVALALNELGIEGWELAASMSENGTAHRLLFKRPWPPEGESAAPSGGAVDDGGDGEDDAGEDDAGDDDVDSVPAGTPPKPAD
jgi:hypothetical protein